MAGGVEKRPGRRFITFAVALVVSVATLLSGVSLISSNSTAAPPAPPLTPFEGSTGGFIDTNCALVTTCHTGNIAGVAYATLAVFVDEQLNDTAPSAVQDGLAETLTSKTSVYNTNYGSLWFYDKANASAGTNSIFVNFSVKQYYTIMAVYIDNTATLDLDAFGSGTTSVGTNPHDSATTTVVNDYVILNAFATGTDWTPVWTTGSNTPTFIEETNVSASPRLEKLSSTLWDVREDASTGSELLGANLNSSFEWGGLAVAWKDAAVPAAPTSVHAISETPTSITIGWTRSNGPATNFGIYDEQYNGVTCNSGSYTILATTLSNPYTVTGLLPVTQWCFKVSQFNTTGESLHSSPSSPIETGSEPGYRGINLTANGQVDSPGNSFFAMSVDDLVPSNLSLTWSLLNSTPEIHILRMGGSQLDAINVSAGCEYDETPEGSCQGLEDSVPDFAGICHGTGDYCILAVPAEINSTTALAYEINYLNSTLHWLPSCWAIGDEPSGWRHFNEAWTSWTTGDNNIPTGAQFALLEQRYIDTIRHLVGATACVIGVESADPFPGSIVFTPTVQKFISNASLDNATYEDFHIYPSGEGTSGNYTTTVMLEYRNLTGLNYVYAVGAVPNARGQPVTVDEFAPGLSTKTSQQFPFEFNYSAAAFTTATLSQALAAGIPHVAYFRLVGHTNSALYNTNTNQPNPTLKTYQYVLDHMVSSAIFNVTFPVTQGNPEIWAVLGTNGHTDETMLISNANATLPVNVTISSFVPVGWDYQTFYQAYPSGVQNGTWHGGNAGVFAMANQSTLLVHFWDPSAPVAPTNLTASSITQGAATVNWTLSRYNESLTNVTLAVGTTAGCGGLQTLYSLGPYASVDRVTGLTASTTYYIDVFAWNITGNGPTSSCLKVSTPFGVGGGLGIGNPCAGGILGGSQGCFFEEAAIILIFTFILTVVLVGVTHRRAAARS